MGILDRLEQFKQLKDDFDYLRERHQLKPSSPNPSGAQSPSSPPPQQQQYPGYSNGSPAFPSPNVDLSAQMGSMNLGGPNQSHPSVLTPGNRYDLHNGAQYSGNVDYLPAPPDAPLRNPLPRPPQQFDIQLPTPQPYGGGWRPDLEAPSPPGLLHANSAPPASMPPPGGYGGYPYPNASSTSLPPPGPGQPQALSTPSTPGAVGGVTQCAGVTKSNKRCTRPVKAPTALGYLSPDEEIPRYCFQHQKEMMAVSGFYTHTANKEWIVFDDYVHDYLHEDTKVTLRAEMEKPASTADVDGYIYCYELRDTTKPDIINLKVGRAVNLVKRIDEWTKSCESKEPILRGWYPGPDGARDGAAVSLMKGKVQAGSKGKNCHRLERLIHLELADLVVHKPYLKDGWDNGKSGATSRTDKLRTRSAAKAKSPKPKAKVKSKSKRRDDDDEEEEDDDDDEEDEDDDEEGSSSSVPSKSKPKKAKRGTKMTVRPPCPDCGQVHKEIFTFERPTSGPHKGKEWEDIVKPVIEKWGKFVDSYT